MLFGKGKFPTVWWFFEDKWDSSGAIREVMVFDIEGARSSPLASKLAVLEGLEGKLKSPFVFK